MLRHLCQLTNAGFFRCAAKGCRGQGDLGWAVWHAVRNQFRVD